jgi:hypothetical protein
MVTNRVFKVLATTGTQMSSLADVTVGSFLVIDEAGAIVTSSTTLDKDTKVQVVVNDAAGQKVFSDKIKMGDIRAYNKEVFRAKVEQVSTLTLATPVTGIEYGVSVIDKSDKEILQLRQAKRTYNVIAASGETLTTLGDKFRALINSDQASTVIASGTVTLVLTAKSVASNVSIVGDYPAQYFFEVFSSSIDNTVYPVAFPRASGTVVYTTSVDFGSGNAYQVRKLEQAGMGYKGITNRTGFPVPQPIYLSNIGTTYDLYILEFDNSHDSNVVAEGLKKSPISLIVAVNAGLGTGTIETILAHLAAL